MDKLQETNGMFGQGILKNKNSTEELKKYVLKTDKKIQENYELIKSKPNLTTYRDKMKELDRKIAELNSNTIKNEKNIEIIANKIEEKMMEKIKNLEMQFPALQDEIYKLNSS